MVSETERRIFGLLEMAERQQALSGDLLQGLTREKEALARERQEQHAAHERWRRDVRQATQTEVRRGLEDMLTSGTEAVQMTLSGLRSELHHLPLQTSRAVQELKRLVHYATWGLFLRIVAGLLGLGGGLWLITSGLLLWQQGRLVQLEDRKAVLSEELRHMEQREQDWKQAGMLQDITRCGPEQRWCVLTDLEAGSYGDHGEYKVLQGG
ncbi:hypothetical protein [Gluconobacter sphaericus]|uniref:Uncharacterized protein n=1 Tax=Gluconobacter sphaericus NBRC 12467 TaxID=1307951 RepID=A0AA37SJV4_9PROT|nr:hypothetical protein [Gluconobacter sphaericus]MBF0886760.1 hypothetical protein [Gluconobacter sphaericus]GBR54946.1 hypothetical protein AA12467_1967 [Gluconobacter sphaericus NBRC 12467]GEB43480.1 hypothetical protein GSP01_22620 [Gluconobacter sphaericus NBRC 12467]GLQ86291.1 hypothetical protein GCM10007872_32050 [Gluconobacter sphaericus NBRC 12467]